MPRKVSLTTRKVSLVPGEGLAPDGSMSPKPSKVVVVNLPKLRPRRVSLAGLAPEGKQLEKKRRLMRNRTKSVEIDQEDVVLFDELKQSYNAQRETFSKKGTNLSSNKALLQRESIFFSEEMITILEEIWACKIGFARSRVCKISRC